jgi:hypothetical protein
MALVKSASPMLTLDELCTDMASTGRHLTRRQARDWWTKGLLPRPRRRGLGRGQGSETFWTEPSVRQQARIAYDLLALYPRADTAILGLWLHGFHVNLDDIRAIYRRSIDHHFRSARGRSGQSLSERVGKLAGMLARQSAKTNAAPKEAQDVIDELAVEFLGVFYGLGEEVAMGDLASRLENVTPYVGGAAWDEVQLQDDDLATWAQYLREMASLPAQLEAIGSATDYELTRAQRLVFFVFGCLDRVADANVSREQFEEFGTRAIVIFVRPALPILIAVLRNEALRQQVVSFVLEGAKMLRQLQWRLPRACQ